MSKTNAINTAATSERELTEDDLALVSGGKPQDGRPVKYMEFQLKEVFITSVH
jgi:hypothetical protein